MIITMHNYRGTLYIRVQNRYVIDTFFKNDFIIILYYIANEISKVDIHYGRSTWAAEEHNVKWIRRLPRRTTTPHPPGTIIYYKVNLPETGYYNGFARIVIVPSIIV